MNTDIGPGDRKGEHREPHTEPHTEPQRQHIQRDPSSANSRPFRNISKVFLDIPAELAFVERLTLKIRLGK